MKKICSFLFILLVIFSLSQVTFAEGLLLTYDGSTIEYNGDIYTIKANGDTVTTDVPSILINDRTLVPIRAVFEKLGASVQWSDEERKATVSLNGITVELKINDCTAVVNGKPQQMDVPAKIINNRTMIPLRFVSENLNMKVGWYPDQKLVTVDQCSIGDVTYSDRTSVTEVSIPVENGRNYNVMILHDPERIVLNLPNVYAPAAQKRIDVGNGIVNAIRYAQFENLTARIVFDVPEGVQYKVIQGDGVLNVQLYKTEMRNISYRSSGDRVYLQLKNTKLTEGGSTLSNLFTSTYDTSVNRYTITFPSYLGDLSTGFMNIDDSMLKSVDVTNDGQQTRITIDAKNQYTYNVMTRYDDYGNLIDTAITVLKPVSRADRLVVIDPGHGGVETGAAYAGILEKDLNLDIALRLYSLLKSKGVNAYLMRNDDSFVGLYERAYIANTMNATLFLSIHNNAYNGSAYGTETLYYPSSGSGFNGKRFAQIIEGNLTGTLGTYNRGIIERPNLVVLKATSMTAALAEVAFMDNDQDRANLQSNDFKQKAAQALCDSIVQALGELN